MLLGNFIFQNFFSEISLAKPMKQNLLRNIDQVKLIHQNQLSKNKDLATN